MDRAIIYPGQVPLETDLLKTNQFGMVGLSKLAQAILGTTDIANGFATTQTVVPSLAVLVGPGEIYSLENLEATAFSSLPQDLAHTITKQGIALDATTLAVTPPGTAGFSINFLVQVDYQDLDSGSAVLPYYNATNPSVAYSGPANSGASQPTTRRGAVVVNLKAGTAAATGTQVTPAPDAGKIGLYVVTVANGASSITNANITPYAGASLASPAVRIAQLTGTNQSLTNDGYQKLPGGLIMQWGQVLSNTSGVASLTFPIAFPASAFNVLGMHAGSNSAIVIEVFGSRTLTGTQFQVKSPAAATDAWLINWVALGR